MKSLAALIASASLVVSIATTSRPALASGIIAPTCDGHLAQHYRDKGIAFNNKHDFLDAFYALSSSIQAIKTCLHDIGVFGYYALMFEASAQLGLLHLDQSEELIGAARQYRNEINFSFLSPADTANIRTNDANLDALEKGIAQARAASYAYAMRRAQAASDHAPHQRLDCDDETIDEVHEDGKVVTMLNGSVFLINDVEAVTSAIWLSTDDVKACSSDGMHFKLIDGSDDVSATKIRG